MPELLVRAVPEDIVEALRRRAAEHGRTEEARNCGVEPSRLQSTSFGRIGMNGEGAFADVGVIAPLRLA